MESRLRKVLIQMKESQGGLPGGLIPKIEGKAAGILAFASLFLLVFSLNCALLNKLPEVDEGYFLTVSSGLLHGKALYIDMLDNKPPGLYLLIAPATAIAGPSIPLIRLLAFFVAASTSFLVYLIGKRLFGGKAGFLAALLYTLASSPAVFSAHSLVSEPISSLFLTAAILLSLEAKETRGYLLAGLLLGIACSARQTALFGIVPILMALKSSPSKLKGAIPFAIGFSLVWVGILAYLLSLSAMGPFITYALLPSSAIAPSPMDWGNRAAGALTFLQVVLLFVPFLAMGAFDSLRKNQFLFAWLLLALLSTQVGYGYPHYYLFAFAPLSLLTAAGFQRAYTYSRQARPARKIAAFGLMSLLVFQALLLVLLSLSQPSPPAPTGMLDSSDAQFAVGAYMKGNISSNESVLLFYLGAHPYYLSGKFPPIPLGFIHYATMAMDGETFNKLVMGPVENSKPDYIIQKQGVEEEIAKLGSTAGLNAEKFEAYLHAHYSLFATIHGTSFEVYKRNGN